MKLISVYLNAYRDDRLVSEYADDILAHWRASELLVRDYMDGQPSINCKMRAILLDWLVEVCRAFKLNDATFFLAALYVDIFVEHYHILRKKYQLVGVVALFIAAKFEAQYPPQVGDIVHVCDRCYSRSDVAELELVMLRKIGSKLRSPTVHHFLSSYTHSNRSNLSQCNFSIYAAMLATVHSSMFCCKYKPSHLAAASVMASNFVAHKEIIWPRSMQVQTGYEESELLECTRALVLLCREAFDEKNLQAVRKTFAGRLGTKL
jgi:hypothetical protein